jgi:hypothetical protein
MICAQLYSLKGHSIYIDNCFLGFHDIRAQTPYRSSYLSYITVSTHQICTESSVILPEGKWTVMLPAANRTKTRSFEANGASQPDNSKSVDFREVAISDYLFLSVKSFKSCS